MRRKVVVLLLVGCLGIPSTLRAQAVPDPGSPPPEPAAPGATTAPPMSGAPTPARLAGLPHAGPACVGWATGEPAAYVVRSRLTCQDPLRHDCRSETLLMRVGPGGTTMARAIGHAGGGSVPVTDTESQARMVRSATPDKIEGVNAFLERTVDAGCVVGPTGTLRGHRFAVTVTKKGALLVQVDDAKPLVVGRLAATPSEPDDGEGADPREELLAVYSHPDVPALALEIGQESALLSDRRYLFVAEKKLKLGAPIPAP